MAGLHSTEDFLLSGCMPVLLLQERAETGWEDELGHDDGSMERLQLHPCMDIIMA